MALKAGGAYQTVPDRPLHHVSNLGFRPGAPGSTFAFTRYAQLCKTNPKRNARRRRASTYITPRFHRRGTPPTTPPTANSQPPTAKSCFYKTNPISATADLRKTKKCETNPIYARQIYETNPIYRTGTVPARRDATKKCETPVASKRSEDGNPILTGQKQP